jgi:ABC-type amino acid transport substrate-binding protein
MKKKFLLFVAIFFCAIIIFTIKKTTNVFNKKVIEIGITLETPPFSFYDKEIKGFDIDILNAIADEIGYEFIYKNVNISDATSLVFDGSLPLAIALGPLEKKYLDHLAFADLYYREGTLILTKNLTINNLNDLEDKKVAVRSEMLYDKITDLSVKKINFVKIDKAEDAIKALLDGTVDAVIDEKEIISYYAKLNNLKIIDGFYAKKKYGIISLQKNVFLLKKIAKALNYIINTGRYATIYEKWFEKSNI